MRGQLAGHVGQNRLYRVIRPRSGVAQAPSPGCAQPRAADYFNSSLVMPLALPKSIWPAYLAFSAAITLPMSLGPAAPVSLMTAAIAALASASLICLGM